MFLPVSVIVFPVDMTEGERTELATRIEAQRMRTFGTKSAAYQAAGINSGTWDRIEVGLPVRDDRLIAAVKALWPGSGGDWRKAVNEVGPPVSAEQWITHLSDRIESLEHAIGQLVAAQDRPAPLPKESEDRDGGPAAKIEAAEDLGGVRSEDSSEVGPRSPRIGVAGRSRSGRKREGPS